MATMQKVSLATRPSSGSFEVPYSTGHQTYSGILSVLDAVGDSIADDLHDSPFTALSNSGLLGWFGLDADRDYHKVLQAEEDVRYHLHLGITHPNDRDVFEALVKAFVIEDRTLPLAHGELIVEEVSTDRTSQRELLDQAAAATDEATGVWMEFRSPTCRERYEDVWEIHPDRIRLFQHLAERWNAVATEDDLELSPTADSLGKGLYTVANTDEYDTHSIVVHRREPGDDTHGVDGRSITADGGHLNEVQGFTGEWGFYFKNASEATQTAVIALAQFAQYSGVGRHNARGAGSVTTDIKGWNS